MSQPAEDDKNLPQTTREVPLMTGDASRALRRGDVKAFAEALDNDPTRLAKVCLALRRRDVAVIGTHEAFVRHTEDGSLLQVIQPVRLSVDDKTLFRIPKREKQGNNWVTAGFQDGACTAHLTYQGLLRINAVVGCSTAQPTFVEVDGQKRANPFVERAEGFRGRPGDIVRVVVSVLVVGPAPGTGNPVAVQYTLDYDPSKDLQHMLSTVSKYNENSCYLASEMVLENMDKGWHYVPVYGGVGYYFDLSHKKIREAYSDFINLSQNAVKKAQTVARRNAMKSHPALAWHTVKCTEDGNATVAAVGWAGDARSTQKWQDITERAARGLDIPDVEVVKHQDVYEPETAAEETPIIDAESSPVDPELEKRNGLIAHIDAGLANLSPDMAAEFVDMDMAHMALEDLTAVKARISALVDTQD